MKVLKIKGNNKNLHVFMADRDKAGNEITKTYMKKSDIAANPGDASSGELEKVEINGTVYSVMEIMPKFRHTVTVKFGDNGELSFTDDAKENTKIDSFQDLTSVFGNTDVSCSGVIVSGGMAQYAEKIHIGTSVTDSTATITSISATPSVTTVTFGTLGFTSVEDSVTTK